MASTKHTIVAIVQDRPGVLNRMVSLVRRRGFNIDSIAVGHSEVPHLSRVTFVVNGTTAVVEQVRKQLDKLIDVVRVVDISSEKLIIRELVLVKVKATSATRNASSTTSCCVAVPFRTALTCSRSIPCLSNASCCLPSLRFILPTAVWNESLFIELLKLPNLVPPPLSKNSTRISLSVSLGTQASTR